jgi:hypothetical protein
VTAPSGGSQRRQSSRTGVTSSTVVTRIEPTPSPNRPAGAPVVNVVRNTTISAAFVIVNASDSSAGRNARYPGRCRGGSAAHAARNGLDRNSSMPVSRSWCVGLTAASTPCSIPNAVCHSMSPSPPTANTPSPTSPQP